MRSRGKPAPDLFFSEFPRVYENPRCTPELVLEYVQDFRRVIGRSPTLEDLIEEFGGLLGPLVAGWELQKRGLLQQGEKRKGDSMLVVLTPLEYMHASLAGFLRNVHNIIENRKDAYGAKGEGYDLHVIGSIGEFVVSKAFNLHWPGPGKLRGDDVGGLMVRTRSEEQYGGSPACMLLHPGDPDEKIFVLVTGKYPNYTVRGWIYAKEGKQSQWWQDKAGTGRECFFVPQAVLHEPETLRPVLAKLRV